MHDTALIIFYEGQQVNKLHVIDSEAQQILARGKMRDVKPEKSVWYIFRFIGISLWGD